LKFPYLDFNTVFFELWWMYNDQEVCYFDNTPLSQIFRFNHRINVYVITFAANDECARGLLLFYSCNNNEGEK
jgi:hypothetical protein